MAAAVDLGALVAPIRSAGLLLGEDRRRRPVLLRLLGPRTVRVTAVGGVWFGQLLVFRALAVGARVVVRTTSPQQWQDLGRVATGRPDRLDVTAGDQPPAAVGGPAQPVFVLDDFGQIGATVTATPWLAHVTLLRQLTARGVNPLKDADVVLLQRLAGAEAEIAAAVLRLEQRNAMRVQALFDDMVAVVGGGIDRHASLTPTPIERELLGPPGRRD
jgi:ESX secretion system protein EccE